MSDATILAERYLSDYDVDQYLSYLGRQHPDLHRLLSRERCREAERHIATMNQESWEFEDEQAGGRGLAYNVAQKSADNRKAGMISLLKCFGQSSEMPGPEFRILDVLGGDGTLSRFCETLGHRTPTIYTADISKFMIDACLAQGLPCIRQSATRSMFRDDALDGVLIAYGSHHLGGDERQEAACEAHRTLKPGGRLVLHDFEIGGRTAAWFDEVVHPYSRTGHPHPHFSRIEMFDLFTTAGFRDVRVFEIQDPFTLEGISAAEARHKAILHLYDMYDLVKIAGSPHEIAPRLERYITETLGPISIRQEGIRYLAEVGRSALVAVGTK
ncbi:class I SAM-dependent methyltransferase [Sphingomonas sp. MMS12-HWE2-04]|uniref:class I SAM-dependent methyltransferase n=1 Tax=Sphingomonas sp. MMS12-HWE2-04 TaxID=3234199 RepID=UPI00384A9046